MSVSSFAAGLIAQIRAVQASLGSGSLDAPAALPGIRDALAQVGVAAGASWQRTQWAGEGGDAASDFTRATVDAVQAMAGRTDQLGRAAAGAADAVARARSRLREIVEEFEARTAALEARLPDPGVADQLVAEARRALADAERVVDELRAELDARAAAVTHSTTAPTPTTPAPTPTTPAGFGGLGSGPGPASGSGLGSASSGLIPASLASLPGLRPDAPSGDRAGAAPTADPGMFGSGVAVNLPDGSTATAPNAVAASAVRHALTQLGVPYDWGGTTPGVGLDCSGLTQWAYHEAGLDLPRLAQEQDIGMEVGRNALRPGDLAVWDGHVAMIVGNGQMIEAGSPVKLSAIRTSNAGQGFQGFWRPTV